MITEKYTQQIWILLAKSFSSVVSDLSQPLWFVLKLIFCRLVLDDQSSRNSLSDPVLATGGCTRCNFCNYNPSALGNTIAGADLRTNIFGLNSMEKCISQFQLHLLCSYFNSYGTCPNWIIQQYLFYIVLVDWVSTITTEPGAE